MLKSTTLRMTRRTSLLCLILVFLVFYPFLDTCAQIASYSLPATTTAVAGGVPATPLPPSGSTPSSLQKPSAPFGPDLVKLFLCKRDITQDAAACKAYVTFFCSGYCTHDGCSDCSNRGVCLDVCGETGATMMACVESNKNCPTPDQVFGNFLTPDAKNSITQYAAVPGQMQFAPSPPRAPQNMMGQQGMMPGMMNQQGMMPGMMNQQGMMNQGMMPATSSTASLATMATMAAMSSFGKSATPSSGY